MVTVVVVVVVVVVVGVVIWLCVCCCANTRALYQGVWLGFTLGEWVGGGGLAL